jgi:hypothetical protein
VGVLAAAGGVRAQCTPEWSAYPGPILNAPVYALTTWDPDGPGPEPSWVIAGGNFSQVGELPLTFVGAWDGTQWRQLGAGVGGSVRCLSRFDPDGAGPLPAMPVVGGGFTVSGSTTLNGVGWYDALTRAGEALRRPFAGSRG